MDVLFQVTGIYFLEIVKRTLEKKMIESDNECVIVWDLNCYFDEAALLIRRTTKKIQTERKVLFINATMKIKEEKQSFITTTY
jgi:hypothetical protein